MNFTFDTVYDQRAVTAMARGLRKTVRIKRSRRSHIFGWGLIMVTLLLTLPGNNEPLVINAKTVLTWATGLFLLAALVFEDKLNAWFACRRMMPGTNRAFSIFVQDSYSSETAAGKTQWRYDNIRELAEDANYFILVFDQRYAQVYDKRTLSGGTVEEFRTFIQERTQKQLKFIS